MEAGDRVASKGVCDIPVAPEVIVKFLDDVNNIKQVDVMND
jgi:hypothetical protein